MHTFKSDECVNGFKHVIQNKERVNSYIVLHDRLSSITRDIVLKKKICFKNVTISKLCKLIKSKKNNYSVCEHHNLLDTYIISSSTVLRVIIFNACIVISNFIAKHAFFPAVVLYIYLPMVMHYFFTF